MLKKLLPKTLFARGMLIVMLPVLLMQLITIYIFFERHLESINRHTHRAFVSEISFIAYLATNQEQRLDTLAYLLEKQSDIHADFYPSETLKPRSQLSAFPNIEEQLKERVDLPLMVNRRSKQVEVSIQLADGVLTLNTNAKRIENQTVDIFILWVTCSALLLSFIALIFLRNQIRPVRELAEVAERFGKGQDVGDFKPTGATEVRRAGRAFLVMRERIKRQIATRTEMLAGISHDLRTPLTRMKLELAMLKDDELADGLRQDVEQMEHMIGEYLAFTRGTQEEETSEIGLATLAEELVEDYKRAGHKLGLDIPDSLFVNIREVAIKRLLNNLIDNAFRYGKHCKLSARKLKSSFVEIILEDDGPGIPEDKREEVLRPFTRLDPARNLNTSGVGLGLSVARDIALNHGGSLELGKADMGGLRVIIRLPT